MQHTFYLKFGIRKFVQVFRDVERFNLILKETDDYVGTVKNDIIQSSHQH